MRSFVFVLALAVSACAPEGGGAAPSPPWNTSWIAQTIADAPVAPPGAVTLNFQNGAANGNAGCNSYNGGVSITGDAIKFANLVSTLMACEDQGRMRQESAYHEILRDAVRFERPTEDRLEIVSAGGRKIAFARKR